MTLVSCLFLYNTPGVPPLKKVIASLWAGHLLASFIYLLANKAKARAKK